jgi:hypothetical protein
MNGISAGVILQTLIGIGVVALLGLNWSLRDSVRDLLAKVGSSTEKGTLINRVDNLETRTTTIEHRNMGIDIVMKQFVRDMKNMPQGGGQRASDQALYEAVELAFGEAEAR